MNLISRITTCVSLTKVCLAMVLFALAAIAILSCESKPTNELTQDVPLSQDALLTRGKYLVMTSACHDCHSPKVMTPAGPEFDTTRLLSGHPATDKLPPLPGNASDWILFSQDLTAFVGPWGVSYAANLTPDATGIEAWTFENFETAIRKGKYKGMEGGRSLLPPMPWQVYKEFTDDDLKAIFAYLKSLKPIDNLVPPPVAPGDMKILPAANGVTEFN